MGIISHDDWSLDRRGQQAQARHKEKVKKAIKQNLGNVITDDGLILSDGRNIIRIPVQSLDEPHFYFNQGKQQHAGQGKGEKGHVIGRAQSGADGPGSGPGAGDGVGERVYEAEVTMDEVEEILFADLRLPHLQPKSFDKTVAEELEWTDVRNKGIRSNMEWKRTFYQALKRSQCLHQPLRIVPEDLRYKTWEEQMRPNVGAVILAMMDVSGSMGEFEKYTARTFFFWMERFLGKHYPHVAVRYLAHHTEAYEVSREEFYHTRESGGTRCSSVYELAHRILAVDYPDDQWNIYPVHVSDGDNLPSDNDTAATLVKKMCKVSSMFAYLEVQARQLDSTLAIALRNLAATNFRSFHVQSREGILGALRHFFREGDVS
jgi:uncharacterized protein